MEEENQSANNSGRFEDYASSPVKVVASERLTAQEDTKENLSGATPEPSQPPPNSVPRESQSTSKLN